METEETAASAQTAEGHKAEIEAWVPSAAEAEEFRLKWLSKKGIIPALFDGLKDVPKEQKRAYGQMVNELRALAEEKWKAAIALKEDTIEKPFHDLSLPVPPAPMGGSHPLTIVRDKMVDIFEKLGFVSEDGPEIVSDWDNFTALNMPPDHSARDMQDTFFLKTAPGQPQMLLRTHTSSVQVQTMMRQAPPIRIISPGRVYRRDNDATHSPVFHQVEGLYIDRKVSMADMKGVLYHFVSEMFGPDVPIRFRPSYFPFTEPSAEMDIGKRITGSQGKETIKWMEIFGCGMVDPAVLTNCGIEPEVWTGFAFGIGVERVAMLKFDVPDIRMFYENDLRFLRQFSTVIL